jgi:toxin ParE1/3/4
MMIPIVWSAAAQRHLRDIREYIAKDSPRYADNVVAAIRRATERLGRFPESGAFVLDPRWPEIREVRSGNYRVLYTLRDDRVMIVAVIHGARDLPNIDV